MRWKIKSPPKEGDRRQRRIFAWKKTLVGNYIVWLEQYYVEEEYMNITHQDFAFGFYPRPGLQWVEIKRDVCDYYI